jgi:hypothetical protein
MSEPLATITSKRGKVTIQTVEDLDAEIDRVARSVKARPMGLTIERRNGDTFMAVVGVPSGTVSLTLDAPGAVVSFTPADGMPPYFVTRGDPSEDGVIAYWLHDQHHGELPRWSIVSNDDARDALRRCVQMESGLPSNVTWEQI